jgi:hypothetical protein
LVVDGHRAGSPVLKRALTAFGGDAVADEQAMRWLWVACTAAGIVVGLRELGRAVRTARESGAPSSCFPSRSSMSSGR